MTETSSDRIRKLLLRADNVLKNVVPGGDPADRERRARIALEEALDVARDPLVPDAVRNLIRNRLVALDALEAGADGPG